MSFPRAIRRRAVAAGLLGVVSALVLTACSGSSGGNQATGGATTSNSGSDAAPSTSASPSPTKPPGPQVSVDISPSGRARSNPLTPIVVKATDGTLTNVTVTNQTGYHVKGGFRTGHRSWSTGEVLGYGKTYKVAVAAKDDNGKVLHKNSTVKVINPPTAYPSVIPPPQATNVGIGMPLTVEFDKAIKDRAAAQKDLNVTSTPAQAGGWYWLSDTQVDYRPATYWKPGTKIRLDIKIYGKNLGGGIYGDTDRTINYQIHDSWVAKADGNTEHMVIYHNGAAVKTMNISMGKESTPTHIGTHVVSEKYREYTMNSCSYGVCSGPKAYISKEYYAERISNDGEFVHENPNSVADQGNTNVSHGCINLNEADAQWFFAHFGVGDVVEVTNSGGPPLPLSDRIGDWSVPWAEWKVGNAGA